MVLSGIKWYYLVLIFTPASPLDFTPYSPPMLDYKIRLFIQEDKKDAAGRCPVRLYVLLHGKRHTKHVGIRVKPRDWDHASGQVRKSDFKYRIHNQTIRTAVDEIEGRIQEAYNKKKEITHALIKNILKGKYTDDDFYKFTESLMVDIEEKYAWGTIRLYGDTIRHLKSFSPQLYFEQVDVNWLRRFESFLIGKGLHNNTIHKHWKNLKRIFNSARKESVTNNYPFPNYTDSPKYEDPDKTYLTLEETNLWEEKLKLPLDEAHLISGYYFLLGCYSGLRFSDWQRFNEKFIQGNRLILRAHKNGELVSIEIHELLRRVIEILKTLPPCLSMQKTNDYLKDIAALAGIKKNVSTHTGRHSFGVRCAELGISEETTAKLMGITVKSVRYYYKVTNRKIDTEFAVWNKLAEVKIS